MTAVAAMVDWGKVKHLTPLELRLAAIKLGVKLDAIDGPPVAAIIGEAPGVNTSWKLPVFPFPSNSAGGRLLKYSELDAAAYLGKFIRKNLYTHLEPWSIPTAREKAAEIVSLFQSWRVLRVVLLGKRVGEAFGLRLWETGSTTAMDFGVGAPPRSFGVAVTCIPHPSGRCREYNDEDAIRRTKATLRWAAGLRRTLP